MPTSRKRRRPSSASSSRRTPPPRRPRDRADLAAVVEVLLAADAAEARGDAAGALALLERNAPEPEGMGFWRPWRVERLRQVEMLGPALPRWAWSRWVLEQALQALSRRDQTTARHRHLRAMSVACELRGGHGAMPVGDDEYQQCWVMDHDWTFRQLHLYDLGGLAAFLDRQATTTLLARADDLRAWARTPVGGYRLVTVEPDVVVWVDLADASVVEVVNTGCATDLLPGEHAIGRVVPTGRGHLFETTPLRVPRATAHRVADDPTSWVDALRAADPAELALGGFEFPLTSDVAPSSWRAWLTPEVHALPVEQVAEATGRRVLDLARELARDHRALLGEDDEERLLASAAWPVLATALTATAVARVLPRLVRDRDLATLDHLAGVLPDPASAVCAGLAADLPRAA